MRYELAEKLREQYMQLDKWYTISWHYVQNVIMKSYMDDHLQNGNEEYYQFVKDFVEKLYNKEGIVPSIDLSYHSIDQIRMANILYPLYDQEKDPKYKKILDDLYTQMITTYPRTESGNFFHKINYPNQVWLDGLYMGQPFYLEYIKRFVDKKDYSDSMEQFRNTRKNAYVPAKKLYYHAYDETKQMFWCDPKTGLSPHVWGRAVGWLVMAFVDTLEILEGEKADQEFLKDYLKEAVDGMLEFQDIGGMWWQVVDYPHREGNYLETSGTAMMVYGILKAIRLGYLDPSYQDIATRAFDGIVNKYLFERDGEVILGGICKSAGLGKHPDLGTVRSGDYDYYVYGEKMVENNGHGVGAFLLAYNEIKKL